MICLCSRMPPGDAETVKPVVHLDQRPHLPRGALDVQPYLMVVERDVRYRPDAAAPARRRVGYRAATDVLAPRAACVGGGPCHKSLLAEYDGGSACLPDWPALDKLPGRA